MVNQTGAEIIFYFTNVSENVKQNLRLDENQLEVSWLDLLACDVRPQMV